MEMKRPIRPGDVGYEVYRDHFLDTLRHTSETIMGFGYKELRVCESSGKRYKKIEIIVEDLEEETDESGD